MGRKPTVNLNLPPRLRVKTMASGKRHYYYDLGGKPRKWVALGGDYILALKQYADYETTASVDAPLFLDAAMRYLKEVAPTKSDAYQNSINQSLKHLINFFGDAPLGEIRPVHVTQFMDSRRKYPISANRCASVFNIIFDHARGWGYTDATNPSTGTMRFKEKGRVEVYVEDDTLKTVYDKSSQTLKDFLDLIYLTGQRPADVLKMDERDIKDGALHVLQNKTKTKLRIEIIGQLADVVARIRKRKLGYKVVCTRLIVNQHGKPITYIAIKEQFKRLRDSLGIKTGDFQMRDLRAKAATDKDESVDMKAAQEQLGHTSERMTRRYVRHRNGKLVQPTK